MPIATNSESIDITLEVNTAKLAEKFSQILKKGDVVLLYGEIGVGKTTFVRHVINNFQKRNNLKLTEVTSPTFNLVNEYDVGNFIIQHYDLFRLKSSKEIKNIGLFENYEKILTLVEWPEKIDKIIKNKISLFFEYGKKNDQRTVNIQGYKN
tara:strand:+ start:259 stop:714 length:456 start_codon:yes stop_codon:yes gene_type:complete